MLHSHTHSSDQSAPYRPARKWLRAQCSSVIDSSGHPRAGLSGGLTRASFFTAAFAFSILTGCSDSEPLPTISVQAPQLGDAGTEESEPVVTSDIIEFAGIREGQTLTEVNATLIPLAQRLFCTQITEEGHDRMYECGEQKILVKLDEESKVTWIGPYETPGTSEKEATLESGGLGVENPASFDGTSDSRIQDASPPRMVDDFLRDANRNQPGARAASVLDAGSPFWIEIPLGDGR